MLDVTHVVTLLDFLARVSGQDADPELQAFLAGWAARLRTQEEAIREAAVALGTVGEWFDRRSAR